MSWIDLTLTIDNTCMTCGTAWHAAPSIARLGRLEEVGRNTSVITLGSHSATHLDAPLHFYNGTYGVDEIPLEKLCGSIRVTDLSHIPPGGCVCPGDLEGIAVAPKMLFKFGWYRNWKTPRYYQDYPYFELETLRYLTDNGLEMLAIDTPSPDTASAIGKKEDSLGHKLLLGKQVVIVEYLNNTEQLEDGGNYEIVALPLKLKGSDGSPCRVIARRLSHEL